ncbi:hypothetical protein PybrP1_000943 [[Pythium] brassicae (nom. inval.)]|nr:hypothetical protein PybrP1_000943 [[Pythium] brassicae (nom. inval.)]
MADDDAGGGGGGSANTQPWGRFKCVSKHPATESDHLNFTLRHHRIGRSGFSADIHIDSGFISKRVPFGEGWRGCDAVVRNGPTARTQHCEITLDTTSGEPVVTLLDLRCVLCVRVCVSATACKRTETSEQAYGRLYEQLQRRVFERGAGGEGQLGRGRAEHHGALHSPGLPQQEAGADRVQVRALVRDATRSCTHSTAHM